MSHDIYSALRGNNPAPWYHKALLSQTTVLISDVEHGDRKERELTKL